jgi:hypothetical protein
MSERAPSRAGSKAARQPPTPIVLATAHARPYRRPHASTATRESTPPRAPQRREVRPPALGHPGTRHPTPQGRGHPRRRMRLTQVGVGRDRLDSPRLQHPRHAVVMHVLAWAAPPGGHPTHAILWWVRLGRRQHTPPRERRGTFPLRLGVSGRPGQPAQVPWPRQTALGRPRRAQRSLPLREAPRVFSPSPAPLAVAQCAGSVARGTPRGPAPAWPVVPSKTPATPCGSAVATGHCASDAPQRYGLTHGWLCAP